jgi:RNA polymerase sigma-70 factor (ECF subfamily)
MTDVVASLNFAGFAEPWTPLIARAQAGDERAWEELIRLTRPWALARLAARVPEHHARQDVAQEVMIMLCRRLETLREPARFAGWFTAMVDNAGLAWGRRRQAQLRLDEAWTGQAPIDAESAAEPAWSGAEDALRRARLTAAFRALSREHQEVLRCRYLQGRDYAETAELLGIDEDRVRGRLQKAKGRLKQTLGQSPKTKTNRNLNFEMNMNPKSELKIETFELAAADLAALRAATLFTWKGPERRPVLEGVCIEPDGRVIATDGRRLVVRRVEALKAGTRRLVLGPARAAEFWPAVEGGRLTPELSVCALEDAAGRRHELPLITEREYPPVEQVFPAGWAAGWRMRAGELRQALRALEPFLEAKHPVEAGMNYTPLLRLRIGGGSAALVLETDKLLGYGEEQARVAEALVAESGWRHAVELRALSEEGEIEGSGRVVGINARYLAEAPDALGLADADELWLRLQAEADTALGFFAARDAGQVVLVMPVRLT